jgi:UDPglucose--hexose-1-phosphate uridylyltransferase
MTASNHIRADPLRATETLYGATRSQRPSDIRGASIRCPFCPGNEELTDALLTAEADPGWESRVVRNLYPAVVEPAGRHEVIVEVRAHAPIWPALEVLTIERILRIYRDREAAALADGYAFVAIFKNAGGAAGASLVHPHSQVIALRDIPRSIVARIARLDDDCPVCASVRGGDERIVERSGDVVAYVPYAGRTAFEVRLASMVHRPRFSTCDDAGLATLAGVLARVMRRLAATLGESMPFNIVVQSAPRDSRAVSLAHWEIEVIPRIESFGGYEVGTGGFLVSRLPEEAAQILRSARWEPARA